MAADRVFGTPGIPSVILEFAYGDCKDGVGAGMLLALAPGDFGRFIKSPKRAERVVAALLGSVNWQNRLEAYASIGVLKRAMAVASRKSSISKVRVASGGPMGPILGPVLADYALNVLESSRVVVSMRILLLAARNFADRRDSIAHGLYLATKDAQSGEVLKRLCQEGLVSAECVMELARRTIAGCTERLVPFAAWAVENVEGLEDFVGVEDGKESFESCVLLASLGVESGVENAVVRKALEVVCGTEDLAGTLTPPIPVNLVANGLGRCLLALMETGRTEYAVGVGWFAMMTSAIDEYLRPDLESPNGNQNHYMGLVDSDPSLMEEIESHEHGEVVEDEDVKEEDGWFESVRQILIDAATSDNPLVIAAMLTVLIACPTMFVDVEEKLEVGPEAEHVFGAMVEIWRSCGPLIYSLTNETVEVAGRPRKVMPPDALLSVEQLVHRELLGIATTYRDVRLVRGLLHGLSVVEIVGLDTSRGMVTLEDEEGSEFVFLRGLDVLGGALLLLLPEEGSENCVDSDGEEEEDGEGELLVAVLRELIRGVEEYTERGSAIRCQVFELLVDLLENRLWVSDWSFCMRLVDDELDEESGTRRDYFGCDRVVVEFLVRAVEQSGVDVIEPLIPKMELVLRMVNESRGDAVLRTDLLPLFVLFHASRRGEGSDVKGLEWFGVSPKRASGGGRVFCDIGSGRVVIHNDPFICGFLLHCVYHARNLDSYEKLRYPNSDSESDEYRSAQSDIVHTWTIPIELFRAAHIHLQNGDGDAFNSGWECEARMNRPARSRELRMDVPLEMVSQEEVMVMSSEVLAWHEQYAWGQSVRMADTSGLKAWNLPVAIWDHLSVHRHPKLFRMVLSAAHHSRRYRRAGRPRAVELLAAPLSSLDLGFDVEKFILQEVSDDFVVIVAIALARDELLPWESVLAFLVSVVVRPLEYENDREFLWQLAFSLLQAVESGEEESVEEEEEEDEEGGDADSFIVSDDEEMALLGRTSSPKSIESGVEFLLEDDDDVADLEIRDHLVADRRKDGSKVPYVLYPSEILDGMTNFEQDLERAAVLLSPDQIETLRRVFFDLGEEGEAEEEDEEEEDEEEPEAVALARKVDGEETVELENEFRGVMMANPYSTNAQEAEKARKMVAVYQDFEKRLADLQSIELAREITVHPEDAELLLEARRACLHLWRVNDDEEEEEMIALSTPDSGHTYRLETLVLQIAIAMHFATENVDDLARLVRSGVQMLLTRGLSFKTPEMEDLLHSLDLLPEEEDRAAIANAAVSHMFELLAKEENDEDYRVADDDDDDDEDDKDDDGDDNNNNFYAEDNSNDADEDDDEEDDDDDDADDNDDNVFLSLETIECVLLEAMPYLNDEMVVRVAEFSLSNSELSDLCHVCVERGVYEGSPVCLEQVCEIVFQAMCFEGADLETAVMFLEAGGAVQEAAFRGLLQAIPFLVFATREPRIRRGRATQNSVLYLDESVSSAIRNAIRIAKEEENPVQYRLQQLLL